MWEGNGNQDVVRRIAVHLDVSTEEQIYSRAKRRERAEKKEKLAKGEKKQSWWTHTISA